MVQSSFKRSKSGVLIALCLGTCAWVGFASSVNTESTEVENQKRHAPVISPALPNQLTLFDEPVPIESFGVREAFEQEMIVNTYRHSSTIL